MMKDFKQFLLRGNVVDLAVGVVVGAAFGAVASSFVKDVLTPLIGAIDKQPDFSRLHLSVHGSTILYGDFLNALISFLIVAFVVFFAVVKPINALVARANRNKETAPGTKTCPECLSEVPIKAKRCAHCGQPIKGKN